MEDNTTDIFEIDQAARLGEYIFLIDRSGSMSGSRIKKVIFYLSIEG